MEKRLIVFDMAGTTVRDFDNVHEALQEALANKDVTVTRDEVNEVMGLPKPIAIEALLKKELSTEKVTDEMVQIVYDDFVDIMVDFYQNDSMVLAKEGAEELFQLLRKHDVKVALDTGFNRKIADTIIERLGWLDRGLIDESITSDEVEYGRPQPDMIFKAMDLLGIDSVSQVAKVGDTVSDLEEGTNAGCKYVIGITTGAYTREQLESHPHTHLINHLREIPEIIGLRQRKGTFLGEF